jgi:hypothetical protein
MHKNMSSLDRGFRAVIVAPAAVIVGAVVGPVSILAIVLYALAVVMLATGAAGSCPLYTLFHIDSRGRRPLQH